MKFFATAALIASVNAACEAGGDMVCAPVDDKPTQCIERVTTKVKSAKDKKYKAALKADESLGADFVFYQCAHKEDADALLASSGVEGQYGITFTVTDKTPEKVEGSGAVMMKGAFAATALALISYM